MNQTLYLIFFVFGKKLNCYLHKFTNHDHLNSHDHVFNEDQDHQFYHDRILNHHLLNDHNNDCIIIRRS